MAQQQRQLKVSTASNRPEMRALASNAEVSDNELFTMLNSLERRVESLESTVLQIAVNTAAIAALDVRVTAHEVAYP